MTALTCPDCALPMDGADERGIHVDRCPRCRAWWFDPSEFDGVLPTARAQVIEHRLDTLEAPVTDRRCPRCDDARLVYLRHGHHELRICPSCRGLLVQDDVVRTLVAAHRALPERSGDGGAVDRRFELALLEVLQLAFAILRP